MYIIYSVCVLLILIFLITLSIVLSVDCVRRLRHKLLIVFEIGRCIICLVLVVCFIGTQYEYLYPFDRYLPVKLYAELIIDYGEQEITTPSISWHGIYEKNGTSTGCLFFDTETFTSQLECDHPDVIIDWPEMDLKNYCYIASYGSRIKTIRYNVWDRIDHHPDFNVKKGYLIFEEETDYNIIYLYQIPRIKMDNYSLY